MLTVEVVSFSYKVALPEDSSGNGGGFIFDCRGILNPGREAHLKHLTGLDIEVQEFLENQTQFPNFFEHCKSLCEITIENFISRGFEHLQIAFGCTGGQHRSVYAAEKLSKYLQQKYADKILIDLKHLNQSCWVLS